MAASAGLVITAGALVLAADLVAGTWEAPKALKTGVATVLAAYLSAGLDKALPGFGTGLGVLLVLGVVYKRGPELMNHILKG
jgi:hypothetical protein